MLERTENVGRRIGGHDVAEEVVVVPVVRQTQKGQGAVFSFGRKRKTVRSGNGSRSVQEKRRADLPARLDPQSSALPHHEPIDPGVVVLTVGSGCVELDRVGAVQHAVSAVANQHGLLDPGGEELQRRRVRTGIPAGRTKLIARDAVPPILSHEEFDGGGGRTRESEQFVGGPAGRVTVDTFPPEIAEQRRRHIEAGSAREVFVSGLGRGRPSGRCARAIEVEVLEPVDGVGTRRLVDPRIAAIGGPPGAVPGGEGGAGDHGRRDEYADRTRLSIDPETEVVRLQGGTPAQKHFAADAHSLELPHHRQGWRAYADGVHVGVVGRVEVPGI